ncbi:MAG: LLM class flavin-dependent oxidoreductase [Acetobacteraceae bacterium]|nr:LLM class flavin-dependent oxidoreductase [Acetobacteraceae bacterium]
MPHPLCGPNRLKLGVFSANSDGGLTITHVPERWAAQWQDVVAVAQRADRAGLEPLLPIARWIGLRWPDEQPRMELRDIHPRRGACRRDPTDRLILYCARAYGPPVYAAKALTTVDHASTGRTGLNRSAAIATAHVVCRPADAAEAGEYYEHYSVHVDDSGAVGFHVGAKEAHSASHGRRRIGSIASALPAARALSSLSARPRGSPSR